MQFAYNFSKGVGQSKNEKAKLNFEGFFSIKIKVQKIVTNSLGISFKKFDTKFRSCFSSGFSHQCLWLRSFEEDNGRHPL